MQYLSVSKQKQCEWADDCYRTAVNVMWTQMSVKQGIKQFKERDVDAIFKENKQLHDMNTFGRVSPKELIPKQKWDALCEINFIMEKRSGKIKGGKCADSRAQREYITKEEMAAPTVSMEELLERLIIEAFEEHATEIFDVPGAYLNADIP